MDVYNVVTPRPGRQGSQDQEFAKPFDAGKAFFKAPASSRPYVIHTLEGNRGRIMASTEIHGMNAQGNRIFVKTLPKSHLGDSEFREGYMTALAEHLEASMQSVEWDAAKPDYPSQPPKLTEDIYDLLEILSRNNANLAMKMWRDHAPTWATPPAFVDPVWKNAVARAAHPKGSTPPVTAQLPPGLVRRREISDPLRAFIQELIATRVEANPEIHLSAYAQIRQSFGGRYICADLFKEVFPEYAHSPATRNLFNACVHNPAAVLSAIQLSAVLAETPGENRNVVMMLSGVPGSGKTSAVLSMLDDRLPDHLHAIFEGQLSNPETTRQKIDQVIQAGYHPLVVVVHVTPEQALRNTFDRFAAIGRGASINVMAEIQSGLPDSLAQIHAEYGDKVKLEVIDRRTWTETKSLSGWEHIETLRSEGNHEQIKARLAAELDRAYLAGEISIDCHRQALGQAPRGIDEQLVVGAHAGQHHAHGKQSSLPGQDSQKALLKAPDGPLPFPVYLNGERYSIRLPSGQDALYVGPTLWSDNQRAALHSIGREKVLVFHDTSTWASIPKTGDYLEVKYASGKAVPLAPRQGMAGLSR